MSELKYIDVAEFRALGYLQEVNRLVLHPAGLALSVRVNDDGTEEFADCWDYRDDPEGMLFGPDEIDPEKIARVAVESARHLPARQAIIGGQIQTEGLTPQQMATYEPTEFVDDGDDDPKADR